MAQTFRDAGTRPTRRVSFTPIYPQRHSIGFDDVLLAEEGRAQYGVVDDDETFLTERGYAGQQFLHGMDKRVRQPSLAPARGVPRDQLDDEGAGAPDQAAGAARL